jgi:hypothetical protein
MLPLHARLLRLLVRCPKRCSAAAATATEVVDVPAVEEEMGGERGREGVRHTG